MTRIAYWTYNSDTHCGHCAHKIFSAQSLFEGTAVDSEDNPVVPMFEHEDHHPDGVHCGTCSEELMPSRFPGFIALNDPYMQELINGSDCRESAYAAAQKAVKKFQYLDEKLEEHRNYDWDENHDDLTATLDWIDAYEHAAQSL